MNKMMFGFLLIAGCASTQPQTPTSVNTDEWKPPTDLELSVSNSRTPAPRVSNVVLQSEETLYDIHIERIYQKFNEENLLLEMCASVHKSDSKECNEQRKKLCAIDQYYVSYLTPFRPGGYFKKPYCIDRKDLTKQQ